MAAATVSPSLDRHLAAALVLWGRAGHRQWMQVCGQSMWPMLRSGDEVYVEHGPAAVRRGDIVLRYAGAGSEDQPSGPPSLLAHRVIAIRGQGNECLFVTRGDNAPRVDPPTGEILGRIVARRRKQRTVNLDTWGWRLVGLGLASLAPALHRLIYLPRRHLCSQTQ